MKFSAFHHFAMMFKLIKQDVYGCEVSFEVEMSLHLKLLMYVNATFEISSNLTVKNIQFKFRHIKIFWITGE